MKHMPTQVLRSTAYVAVSILSSLLFSGCATAPHPLTTEIQTPEGLGTVVLYSVPQTIWQKNVSIGAALLVVDGVEVGKLGFGKKAYIHLKPGKRNIEVYVNDMYPTIPVILKGEKDWSGTVEVKAGLTQAYALHYQPGKVWPSSQKVGGSDWVFIEGGNAAVQTLVGEIPTASISFAFTER
jgi:hypothetical protein